MGCPRDAFRSKSLSTRSHIYGRRRLGQSFVPVATLSSNTPELPCLPCLANAAQGVGPPGVRAAGGAPSAEMRLVQHARDVARAAAQASGSGRRARAPSLKALRAAGLLDEEGTQLLTKAMNAEESRKSRQRREQWRAGVAVGLRVGHVIEALTSNDSTDEDQDDSAVGTGGRGTWRRLTAEETLTYGGETGVVGSNRHDGGPDVTGRDGRGSSGSDCAVDGVVVVPVNRESSEVDRDGEDTLGSIAPGQDVKDPTDSGAMDAEGLPEEGGGKGDDEGLSGSHAMARPHLESCRKKRRLDVAWTALHAAGEHFLAVPLG